MRKSFFISILILLSVRSYGSDCTNLSPQESHALPVPAYYISASGDRYVLYNRMDNRGGSYAYDLKMKKVIRLSKMIDAYASTDGEIFILPYPFRIMRTSDAIKLGPKAKPLYIGKKNEEGNYPTVGVNEREGRKFLRVIGEIDSGLILNEYELGDLKAKGAIRKSTPEPVALCGNLGKRFMTMPIISRDGTMLSASVYKRNTTQIFKIEMPSGDCELLVDLGIKTNKPSFSFDGSKVAYKTYANKLIEFDLHSRKATTLVDDKGYIDHQAYRPDGSLVYSEFSGWETSELKVLPPNASNLCSSSQPQVKSNAVQ